MYLSKTLAKRSLIIIGYYCGGRDHTSVLVAIRNIESESRTDKDLYRDLVSLKAEILSDYLRKGEARE